MKLSKKQIEAIVGKIPNKHLPECCQSEQDYYYGVREAKQEIAERLEGMEIVIDKKELREAIMDDIDNWLDFNTVIDLTKWDEYYFELEHFIKDNIAKVDILKVKGVDDEN